MRDELEAALAELRPGFQADGVDVQIGRVESGGSIEVRIVLGQGACEECLLPADALAELFTAAFRPIAGDSSRVEVTYEKAS